MASVRERVEPIWQQFQSFIGNPKIILPAVGVIAFWAQRNKEFSTGQLIAIGIGVAPWLLRFVKSMELFGQKLDFQNQTPEETKASLENRVLDTEAGDLRMTGDDAKLAVNPEAPQRQNTPTLRLGDFLNSERAALNKLASMYGGQVKADVKLGGIAWDGLIKTQSDHIVVEIKHVSPGQRFDPDSFKITLVQMIRSRRSGMADAGVRVPEIAVIIIVHDPAPEKLLQVQEIAARVSDLTGASVWVWPSNELSYAAS